eukprot:g30393.t1
MPKDFQKDVGRISQKDLLEKYGCKGERMLVSVYGDLFDVSDRPDKYGPDGPYMTGKDITWALVSGEDSEENMDKFYDARRQDEEESQQMLTLHSVVSNQDIFKIQPQDAADRRLQGLMSWWAFYEKDSQTTGPFHVQIIAKDPVASCGLGLENHTPTRKLTACTEGTCWCFKDALAQVTTDRPVDVRVEDEKTLSQVSLAAPMLQAGLWAFVDIAFDRNLSGGDRTVELPAFAGDEGRRRWSRGRLRQWLLDAKMHEKHRWIIYIHLLAPDAPLGMLELLSSPIYQAISLSSASLISGGMLRGPALLRRGWAGSLRAFSDSKEMKIPQYLNSWVEPEALWEFNDHMERTNAAKLVDAEVGELGDRNKAWQKETLKADPEILGFDMLGV